MLSLRTLSVAHDWVIQVISDGDTVIDATVGNGHDALFLARRVGDAGSVVGFDVQPDAVDKTRALLSQSSASDGVDYSSRVTLHTSCHSRVGEYCQAEISVAMFNLGYLPNSDKSVITQKETTLKALETCLALLKPKGLLTIVCYPGHEGGEDEASAVNHWARDLDSAQYSVLKAVPHNPRTQAPYLIGIQKGR